MTRIKVSVMNLEPREQFIVVGGTKQDRARTLFIGLLPPGDGCYTASEVVKKALPRREDHAVYLSHYKSLDSLARVHGLAVGKNPGPDNVNPVTGKRLPGKKPGTYQSCRWNRKSWLAIVSDEMYEWLLDFNQRLESLAAASPPGATFYCELDGFKLTAEAPLEETLSEKPAEVVDEDKPSAKAPKPRWNRHMIAGIGGIAAGVLIAVMLWPKPVEQPPHGALSEAELVLDYSEYIRANRNLASNLLTPNPTSDRAPNWKPDHSQAMAATNPPPSFLAGGEPIF